MSSQTRVERYALVTGGTSGIGLETARGLASQFDVVGIVGRNAERLATAATDLASTTNARIETFRADFASLDQVRGLARKVRESFGALDVLVNNAGVWHKTRKLSIDGYEESFAVNHLAHFLLTRELQPLLIAGAPSRVVNVSSTMHFRLPSVNWDDPMFERDWPGGLRAYSQSKLANVIFSNELARRWASIGVSSNSLNPGNVRSRITRNNRLLNLLHMSPLARLIVMSEQDGAKASLHVATAPELEGVSGRYFEKQKEVRPNPAANDVDAGRRLWELSERLVDESG